MSHDFTIGIKPNEELIVYKLGEYQGKKCEHHNVTVSIERNDIYCQDCKMSLNPIFWIESHLKHLNEVCKRNSMLLAELMAIQDKIGNDGTYVCKHCLEANEVNFKKLLSHKAIGKRLQYIDSEVSGYKVLM